LPPRSRRANCVSSIASTPNALPLVSISACSESEKPLNDNPEKDTYYFCYTGFPGFSTCVRRLESTHRTCTFRYPALATDTSMDWKSSSITAPQWTCLHGGYRERERDNVALRHTHGVERPERWPGRHRRSPDGCDRRAEPREWIHPLLPLRLGIGLGGLRGGRGGRLVLQEFMMYNYTQLFYWEDR
jgi:hypothetical protein